jgi:hypothetical protein
MQHRDDGAEFGINNNDHAFYPLLIGRWNGASQSSELPATDHERPTSASHKRSAVSIGKNCLQSSHRYAPRLRSLACVMSQNQWRFERRIGCSHDPVSFWQRERPPLLKGRNPRQMYYIDEDFFGDCQIQT